MLKKIVVSVCAVMMTASVAMAAPVTDLEPGKVNIGYNYSNFNAKNDGDDLGNYAAHGVFVQGGLSEKFNYGIEYNSMTGGRKQVGARLYQVNDQKNTDVTVQYKVDKGVRLIGGFRHYEAGSTARALYGIAGKTSLGKNVDGYAVFQKTDVENEWQVGVTTKLSANVSFDLNYKSHDLDGASVKGLGFGVSTTF